MPEGVYISAVSSGSGAATAGLTKGDIITGINGKKVTTTAELKSYLSYYAVGDTVTVTIERPGDNGYTSKSVDVKLTAASKETKESESSAQSGTDNSGNSGDSGSNGDNSENDIRQFFFGGQGGSNNGGY
jgi:serine protease Do